MAALWTQAQVGAALKAMGHSRVATAVELGAEGPRDLFAGHHFLALGLRESGGENIVSYDGHDRGCFMVNDYWHSRWLSSQPGCPSGSWRAVADHTALEPGYVPRFTPALIYAFDVLQQHVERAEHDGVPEGDRRRLAFSAYNQGYGGALRAYRAGDVDKGTAGNDYSAWVENTAKKVYRWLNEHPNWKDRTP